VTLAFEEWGFTSGSPVTKEDRELIITILEAIISSSPLKA